MARQTAQGDILPQLPAPVLGEAARFANQFMLSESDARRAQACLEKLVRTFAADLANHPDKLESALAEFPLSLLQDATWSLGFEEAADQCHDDDRDERKKNPTSCSGL